MFEHFFHSSSGGDRAIRSLTASLVFAIAFSADLSAQNAPVPQATYPSQSTATSTSVTSPGVGTGATQAEIDMMQIRSAAMNAERDAAAATMAISADRAIDERNQQAALEAARETKRLKRDVATRMKWEKAQNAYNRVSSEQMSTWKDTAGNVRVERNVPNEFLLALRAEEAAIAARNEEEEEPGFGPFRATKKMMSWRPFKKSDDSDSATAYEEAYDSSTNDSGGGGFMSNLRAPRLPFMGRRSGGNDDAVVAAAPQVQASAPAPAASGSVQVTKPGSVPRISGAALVDGSGTVNVGAAPRSSAPPVEQVRAPTVQAEVPSFSSDGAEEKKGLFSMFKSNRSGSMFGSRKAAVDNGGGIDAGLFPENAVNSAPTGGNLSGNYSASSETPEEVAVTSTGDFELPGQEVEKKRKKFSMPKPNLSIPKIASGSSEQKSSSGPSLGTGYYVVANQAQFMQYGESQMESEVRALPAGVVVRLTKPGADWATIQLTDGSSGVIQTKNLRAASSGEVPAQFSSPSPSSGGGGY